MPQFQNIRFKDGINRYPDATSGNPSIPFDLNNARVHRSFVRPVQEGEPGCDISGSKPFFSINPDLPDCNGVITGCPGNGSTAIAGDWHNSDFYASSCGCPDDACAGSILQYPAEWDGNPITNVESVPRITEVFTPLPPQFVGTAITSGVGPKSFATYRLIPIDEDGQAGEWETVFVQNSSSEYMWPEIRFRVNAATDYVAVYRSPDKDFKTGSTRSDTDICEATQFYFVKNIDTALCPSIIVNPEGVEVDAWGPDFEWQDKKADKEIKFGDQDPNNVLHRQDNGNIRIFIKEAGGLTDGFVPANTPDVITVVLNGHASSRFFNGQEIDVVATGRLNAPDGPGFNGGTQEQSNQNVDVFYVDIADVTKSINYQRDIYTDNGNRIQLILGNKQVSPVDPTLWGFQDRNPIRFIADANGKFEAPEGESLSRQPNVWTYGNHAYQNIALQGELIRPDAAASEPLGVCARAALNDGGTMMWGNIKYPTKQPVVGYFSRNVLAANFDVAFQYEYEVSRQKFYGPLTEIPDTSIANIEFGGGEIAVLVYVDNGGGYQLWERISIKGAGSYTSECAGCLTFNADAIDVAQLGAAPEPVTDCLEERNKVFLSKALRPKEITFEQFSVAANEEVRHLSPARLDEEENIRDYAFYVATDRSIYYANRKDRAVALDKVTPLIGVELGIDGQPLWTTAHFGNIFVGTDGHTYYISGRDLVRLDRGIIETPGKTNFFPDLWGQIFDIEYHTRFREVWFATDTGLWAYDMGELNPGNRTGVVANYNFVNRIGRHVDRLWYDDDNVVGLAGSGTGNMILLFDLNNDLTNQTTRVAINAGTYLDNVTVTTGRVNDTTRRSSLERIEIAHDPMPNNRIAVNGGAIPGVIPAGGYDPLTLEISTRDARYVNTANNAAFPPNAAQQFGQRIEQVEPYTPVYPRIGGVGDHVTFEEFEELRGAEILLVGNPKER